MLVVARAVFKLEKRGARWKKGNEDAYKRSKQATKQAFLYLLSFLVTWVFLTANLIIAVSGNWAEYGKFPLIVLELLFIPMQGFFNALVYWRPVYMKSLKKKKSNEESTNWSAWSWRFSTSGNPSSSVLRSPAVLDSVNGMDEEAVPCSNEMDKDIDSTRRASMDTELTA